MPKKWKLRRDDYSNTHILNTMHLLRNIEMEILMKNYLVRILEQNTLFLFYANMNAVPFRFRNNCKLAE